MKRIISFALVLVMIFSLLCACDISKENQQNENSSLGNPDNSQVEENQNQNENNNVDNNDGNDKTLEKTYPWNEVPKTLKVLAIGNSFSVDAMEYLYQIAKDAGVKP